MLQMSDLAHGHDVQPQSELVPPEDGGAPDRAGNVLVWNEREFLQRDLLQLGQLSVVHQADRHQVGAVLALPEVEDLVLKVSSGLGVHLHKNNKLYCWAL